MKEEAEKLTEKRENFRFLKLNGISKREKLNIGHQFNNNKI